ncbi:uncharacterized protein LOC132639450 [Lycium barbarum]|uniref:uncharacterized protein LOC132639450 n=1 Tax=Lycium barbarum TaxID=112863 RepID=UPI00293EF25D|nr:uncharacterized protein LOC132639450 [Lycium barbarum]
MDEAESVDVSTKDPVWKYTISNSNEKYFKCKFCKQQCTGSINRLKHHLAGTRNGMKPCPKVPGDVAVECSHIGGESGNSSCNDAISPKRRGPIDNFVNSQARQATLNSKWKKEERKLVCQQIGRFFFSSGIPFNVANDPYYLPMFDGVENFGPDSWSDGKSRCFINFLVNSPDDGTWPHMYWTPCAAHCIDLMLEDKSKLKIHQETLKKAKDVVKFIYGHTWVLDLMRSFTKNHELLRPVVTRFTTAYLTLQSIQKQKQALRSMFSSEAWNTSTWANKHEGVKTRATVLFDQNFWPHIAYCVKSVTPLVSVLREVDSEEKPCMGYMYHLMTKAKENIAFNCGNNEKSMVLFGEE